MRLSEEKTVNIRTINDFNVLPNNWFHFKQFTINQENCAMKIGTDSILLGAWANCYNKSNILDIGTGTGVLALMLAQKENKNIFAIDIDKNAANLAKQNVNNSRWTSDIQVFHSSLQEFNLPVKKFNFIITNPPYFSKSLKSPQANRTTARHTYTLTHREIIDFYKNNLSEKGKSAIILPVVDGENFIKQSAEINLFCIRKCFVQPNQFKKPHRLLLEFSFEKQITQESEIIIENGVRHHYTDEYKKLTEEFYLSFKY